MHAARPERKMHSARAVLHPARAPRFFPVTSLLPVLL